MQRVDVLTIGAVARPRLGEARGASLLGVTRRGWLVLLDVGWVIFLSREARRGPLTLNLAEAGAGLPPASPGLTGEVTGDGLIFAEAGLRVDFGQAALWQAPPAPAEMLPAAERSLRLAEVKKTGNLDVVDSFAVHNIQISEINAQGLVRALEPLLGLGRGLTPSGDDLAVGLLLTLSRWGKRLGWEVDLAALGEALAALAARRTTTLAANLIACACLGQADERLLLALDGIVSGEPGPAECAAALRDWGASSGVDALVGMTLVLQQTK